MSETTTGTKVFVAEYGGALLELHGYVGGLQLGMDTELIDEPGHDDGINRVFPGNSTGGQSTISVAIVPDDPAQAMVKRLAGAGASGYGVVRVVEPSGLTVEAEGVLTSYKRVPYEPDQYMGFTFVFAQNEPETEV